MLLTPEALAGICTTLSEETQDRLASALPVQSAELLAYLNDDRLIKAAASLAVVADRVAVGVEVWVEHHLPSKRRRRGAPRPTDPDAPPVIPPPAALAATSAAASPRGTIPILDFLTTEDPTQHAPPGVASSDARVAKVLPRRNPATKKPPKRPAKKPQRQPPERASSAPPPPPCAASATPLRHLPPTSESLRQRTELSHAPPLWCEAAGEAADRREAHVLVAMGSEEEARNGACNRILAWADRHRTTDVRTTLRGLVLLPSPLLRYVHPDHDGCHLRCTLRPRDTQPLDEILGHAFLLAIGHRIAFRAPHASVEEVDVHSSRRALGAYLAPEGTTASPSFPGELPQDAWLSPVAREVLLWANLDDHWRGVATEDPRQPFWVHDGLERTAAEFWAHLAPGTPDMPGQAFLRLCWEDGVEGGVEGGMDGSGQACQLFAQPPRAWFDALDRRTFDAARTGEERAAPSPSLRLVLVRCLLDSSRPSMLPGDRCLPLAIVRIAPGAWFRTSSEASLPARRERVSGMRRLAGLAEAAMDAFLLGTVGGALPMPSPSPPSSLGQRTSAVPTSLVCDDRICAYASAMAAHIRDQRAGVDLTLRFCHRLAAHHAERRFLSFLSLEMGEGESGERGMGVGKGVHNLETWYAQLFERQGCPAAEPGLEFRDDRGSLRRVLAGTGAAWGATGGHHWSNWACDVLAHALHNGFTGSPREAILLAVSTTTELRCPKKVAVADLPADAHLESVLWVDVATPVADLPEVCFEASC